ncbi:hypothetical protein B0H11DRAFT_2213732 [Mycena galericulata]|nr:hypothetical protein B0H11DRAFT_2213732 [Mycena galericulata]
MPPTTVKTEFRSHNATASDPYTAAVAALEQAQRASSIARGQPLSATILVAEPKSGCSARIL